MAKESFLDLRAIPAGNIFRMRGEIDPNRAASEYEEHLAAVAGRCGEAIYVHDLILLGMGPDGHTASLFPALPRSKKRSRLVIPVIGPKPPPQRITMTFPLLNAARNVCFLVNDGAKLPLVEQIMGGDFSYPAARVQPTGGASPGWWEVKGARWVAGSAAAASLLTRDAEPDDLHWGSCPRHALFHPWIMPLSESMVSLKLTGCQTLAGDNLSTPYVRSGAKLGREK